MPKVRVPESSDESDSDVPLSIIIRAQSNFFDETQAPLDNGRVQSRLKRRSHERAQVVLNMDKASEDQVVHNRRRNVRSNQPMKNDTKQRQRMLHIKQKKEHLLEEEVEDDVPLHVNVSRLSKSKRTKQEKKEPKRVIVESGSSDDDGDDGDDEDDEDDDDDDDDDVPLVARMHKLSKEVPRTLSKQSTRNDSNEPRPKAPSRTKKRTRGGIEPKRVAKRQRTAKEEDVSARKFERAGQRRETPPDNDPSRLFYESMYNEKLKLGKTSSLAEQWMLRHGLLEEDVAREILEKLAAGKMVR